MLATDTKLYEYSPSQERADRLLINVSFGRAFVSVSGRQNGSDSRASYDLLRAGENWKRRKNLWQGRDFRSGGRITPFPRTYQKVWWGYFPATH